MKILDCTNHGVLVKPLDTKTPKKGKSDTTDSDPIPAYTLGCAIAKLKHNSTRWCEVRISLRQSNADIPIKLFCKIVSRIFHKYDNYLEYVIVPDYSDSERLHAHGIVSYHMNPDIDGLKCIDVHEIYKHIVRNLKHNLGYSSIGVLKYPDSFISYMFGLYTAGHDKYKYGSYLRYDRVIRNYIGNLFSDTIVYNGGLEKEDFLQEQESVRQV